MTDGKADVMRKEKLICCMVSVVLAGCASAPVGPRVAVMPAPGKPFDQFMVEEQICRHYAEQSVGQPANDAAAQNFAGGAFLGTVIGAAVGAFAGGEKGAAIGAAAGLAAGSAAGSSQSARAAWDAQRLYDIAYQQCMYAKGNQVPGYAIQQTPPVSGAETPALYPPKPMQFPYTSPPSAVER